MQLQRYVKIKQKQGEQEIVEFHGKFFYVALNMSRVAHCNISRATGSTAHVNIGDLNNI